MYEGSGQDLSGPCTATTNIYSSSKSLSDHDDDVSPSTLYIQESSFLLKGRIMEGKITHFIVDYFQI
jgi:hypothetical protein